MLRAGDPDPAGIPGVAEARVTIFETDGGVRDMLERQPESLANVLAALDR